ncbi:hypothetical protein [Photobacterium iliopiscarium]|uniref:hypothetical protein n=1 Tax=Photobacterium iliopiscarium TaxID=56192 RepID=UPI0005D32C68|nr:hypothetical protein [Photobacterium iliopiscarium]KJG12893.1 hypothetical protein UB38_12530 [Photobacterium iliopiscarium]PST97647.1 hypothetical protein C9I85_17835 [Photobacterium iliopiscarium]PSV81540.1 hypothetical protein C9J51_14075 [Photobacterium iliopiscarium]
MLKFKSTIFSDENDIYIALQSNKAKLSENALRKLVFKRGIIYPISLDRDELIGHISDLPFSYSHLTELTNRLTPKINRDQYSVKRIAGKFDLSTLNDVVEKVKEGRPRFVGAEYITPSRSIQSFYVEIDYTEFDFGRGKYQQKKRHGGYIQFLEKKNYISIQYTYTKRIKEILNDIIKMYRDTVNKDFIVQDVDLSAVLDADLRNQFMLRLYDTVKPLKFLELEKVRVSKVYSILDPSLQGASEACASLDEDVLEDDLDSDLLDGDSDAASDELKDERECSIYNAQFDGQLLHDADEVTEFCNNNFYRSRIKWSSKALSLKDKPIVTFELTFDDKHQAKDLKFRIIGKEAVDGKGGKEPVDGADFNIIIRELEDAIFKSLDDVLALYEGSSTDQKEVSNA